MEQKLDNKLEFRDRLLNIYYFHKAKIYFVIFILILISLFIIFFNHFSEKKNKTISEKYIQAGIYISLKEEDNAKNIYEEIITSKNEFYSILSLNSIIEKKLISDSNKILEYFNKVEKNVSNEETKDLLSFKKALYIMKNLNSKEGEKLLENLIEKNSELKFLAQEILKNK